MFVSHFIQKAQPIQLVYKGLTSLSGSIIRHSSMLAIKKSTSDATEIRADYSHL